MKMILGLMKMDSGEILVDGTKVLYGNTPTNRKIGYLPDVPEFSRQELMAMERETTGLYLSGHPMDDYRENVRKVGAVPIGSILTDFQEEEGPRRFADGQSVVVAGIAPIAA